MKAVDHLGRLPFPADRFQVEAAEAFDLGANVVVTAPTGSGKTVVAEAAIASVVSTGRRAIYTTPIKALSNQKFGDLRGDYGDDSVGLLTGDNAINGRAPIVVMTTEVLRNMMYAGSPELRDVGVVVLDEVHYLQDRSRGAVWEEIIIHLDKAIPLVCLSATVANADEFADWVRARRGDTELIIETERPVPLESLYMVRDRWSDGGDMLLLPVFAENGSANNRIKAMFRARGRQVRRYATPRRFETVSELTSRRLLPVIYFIFSRAGCDAAAKQVVDRGLRLTTPEEAAQIRHIAAERTAHLPQRDLGALGYGTWLHNLEAGVGSHHAGLVPAFKETVEELFATGLIRLVFATETLALGINMPARTTVIESLSKFDGESHELLRPGDYTQLTGRAGRRGIDTEGTAVVLHSPYVPFDQVAAIAAAGSHPLESSFAPSYNMVVNLVARYEEERAEEMLRSSFAEFRSERGRARIDERAEELIAALRSAEAAAECDVVDIDTWLEGTDDPEGEFLASLDLGDVVTWTGERFVVVSRGYGSSPWVLVVDGKGRVSRVNQVRVPAGAHRLGAVELPEPYRPRETAFRNEVARRLKGFRADPAAVASETSPCPDLAVHLEARREIGRLRKRLRRLERQRTPVDSSVVKAFQARQRVLESLGYLEGWSLTRSGSTLRFLYNELDLLLAETLASGELERLDEAELAATASMFTYVPRREAGDADLPNATVSEVATALDNRWRELAALEHSEGVVSMRAPEFGFASTLYAWAMGDDLADVLGDEETGGDFVRNARQALDLLRQLRDEVPALAEIARAAVQAVDRGVVAAEGVG